MNKTEIPSDPNVRWEWIKYQLRARGQSLAMLARSLDLSNQAVKNAKRTPYPRVERAIATALDLSPLMLWPERWIDEENPKRQRPNRSETLKTYIGEASCSIQGNRYAVLSQRKATAGA
ncbi:helix-turn-helix domain-containing protein [Pseudomonas sp. CAN2814]|uniref:helix-turn-helix domain-containing protein n=1 Tax=Pseudomonas sp. CAN1 TaxID=3046726 RepID=UPI002649E129|nr:helix-turn-helix domain-containing protein [Pseudomonas sp. CAN1]MDN6854955.1 helix-turn-helix domain-containing protein [Pseudomonas sp. CAN1]